MPLRDMLATYYDIRIEEKLVLDGKEGYKQAEYIYFIISVDNKEMIYMEQSTLAYYLVENQYDHMAMPIPNIHGDWFTTFEENNYMVLQVKQFYRVNELTEGKVLANFHQIGTEYSYEPQAISSYGQWKQLWIDKLTFFEKKIEQQAQNNSSDYYRLAMDVLPYLIGISENAIQYIQESEQDYRFHEADKGTIAFRRYRNNLHKPILWLDDLVYDHPIRDLAEYIRFMMINNVEQEKMVSFINDYQSIRPLSIFSWRLLYARLIFPIHIFDLIDHAFLHQDINQSYNKMEKLLEEQTTYERKLREFYKIIGLDRDALHIPVLHWL